MFDKLEDLVIRYEEIMGELQEPGVAEQKKHYCRWYVMVEDDE